MNIVLCGMMGSGKTTVAAALAKKYGYKYVDTDEIIVKRYGVIDKIFAECGEDYFRDIESKVTEEVSREDKNIVISLGGGCVIRKENVKNLKRTGKIFYLRVKAETVIKRLQNDTTRPLLKGNLKEKVNTIINNRSGSYILASDVVIDTDDYTPEQIADKIKEFI